MMFARTATAVSFLLCLVSVGPVAAQHRSVLRGEAIDADGRPAAAVTLTLVSESTGLTRRTTTDGQGRFTFLQLEPDIYRLSIEGERTDTYAARVSVTQGEVEDVRLYVSLGSITADADTRPFFLSIERTSPALRTQLDETLLMTLPLDGRRMQELVLLTPGVTAGEAGPVSSGTPLGSTLYRLDGALDLEPILLSPAALPIPETTAALEIVRFSTDASFARTAGAHVNVLGRSGTNTPSGGAFAFYQSAAERLQTGAYGGAPLKTNRAFVFGGYQHSHFGDAVPRRENEHQVDARADYNLHAGGRLTGRYTMTDQALFERRGQNASVSVVQPFSTSIANEARFGFSRTSYVPFGGSRAFAANLFELGDTLTWTTGPQITTVGGEWYGATETGSGDVDAVVLAGFGQSDWRVSRRASISGGVRVEHYKQRFSDGRTTALPRVGFAWMLDEEQRHTVRGGYGRYAGLALHELEPKLHQWSIAADRQMGRSRVITAALVGSRAEERFGNHSRYDALQLELQQRSDTGLGGHFAYTIGRWRIGNGAEVDSPLHSRHKVTAAFMWRLPIGHERAFLSDGVLGRVLEDMLVTGIAAVQSGRPRFFGPEGQAAPYRSVDLALLKDVRFGSGRSLQLRFETFNVANRMNPPRALFGANVIDPLSPEPAERRYQFGGRFVF